MEGESGSAAHSLTCPRWYSAMTPFITSSPTTLTPTTQAPVCVVPRPPDSFTVLNSLSYLQMQYHPCTCRVALPCCLFDLACFFLPSFSSLIKTCILSPSPSPSPHGEGHAAGAMPALTSVTPTRLLARLHDTEHEAGEMLVGGA